MNNKVIIVGASGQARVVIDIVECEGRLSIVGILDRKLPAGTEFQGYKVLGSDDDADKFASLCDCAIVAVGDNFVRSLVVGKVGRFIPFGIAVHPSSTIAGGVTIGPGTVVMAKAVVNPGCAIGSHCILNTASALDHDSTLGDFASLAPGVVTGGNCHIGDHSAVGIGAILRHGVTIGADSVIGAGALVMGDIGPNAVAYGTPARIVRERNRGDRYL